MGVEGLLSADERALLDRNTVEATGLPNRCYTDKAFFEAEGNHLFARNWTCVGVASEIPNPGDVKPVSVAGRPLVLVRDRDGGVRCFHNVCSHRGAQLVTKPCQGVNALRCPYHSWVYDLQGKLRATPHVGGPGQNKVEGFSRDTKGLQPVRSAVWWDMIFVDLSGEAVDFEAFSGPLSERWASYEVDSFRHGGLEEASLSLTLRANWKLAAENYVESYHLPWVHPGLNAYSKLEDHYHIIGPHFMGQGSTKYAPLMMGALSLPVTISIPEEKRQLAEYVALFPNVLLGVHSDHYYVILLTPEAPDLTVETLHIYYRPPANSDESYAETRRVTLERWREVFVEDVDLVERLQLGRKSPAFGGGCFSPVMDAPTHAFHQLIANHLA